jgi:thiamine biosynthesis lipoprotein
VSEHATAFNVWGMSGTIATERHRDLTEANQRLWHWIGAIDAACNRFNETSEISRLNRSDGATMEVSETFELALDAAQRSYEATGGLCDPTILAALVALGYDRDYDLISADDSIVAGTPRPALGLDALHWDREAHTVSLDTGCQIDLGASAKALCADLVADDLAALGGVIVEIGGDVAVHGQGSKGPWAIGVSDSLQLTGREPRVSLAHGGVATSSTSSRTWRVNGEIVNHVIDPRTGRFAQGTYATASVSAASCVLANAFATAALLWDDDAVFHIAQAGWSARLVRRDGTVEFIGGWPEDGRTS